MSQIDLSIGGRAILATYLNQMPVEASFEISTERLLQRLGRSSDIAPSPRLTRQMNEAIDCVMEYARPWTTQRIHAMEAEPGWVRVSETVALRSFRLARSLRPCHTIHVYLVTLGEAIDQVIMRAMHRQPAFGVVVDAAASVAAESLVETLHDRIEDELPWDETRSLPFSPGYCDWPLREQQKLFALFATGSCGGVVLSRDCLMRPRKSISGVIGIGPRDVLDEIPSPCVSCGRKNCPYRRV